LHDVRVIDRDHAVIIGHEELILVRVELAVTRLTRVFDMHRFLHGLRIDPFRWLLLSSLIVQETTLLIQELTVKPVNFALNRIDQLLYGQLAAKLTVVLLLLFFEREQRFKKELAAPWYELSANSESITGLHQRLLIEENLETVGIALTELLEGLLYELLFGQL
jgi:hypothetical protein